jgi:hypothetical protein
VGDPAHCVLRVPDDLLDQPLDVAAAQAVEARPALGALFDQTAEAEFGQMLARRGGRAAGGLGQGADAQLALAQRPQQTQAAGLGQEFQEADGGSTSGSGRVRSP